MPDLIPSRRRWYQFSLRTMFVVVTLVSILLGWVMYSLDWIRQRNEWLDRSSIWSLGPTDRLTRRNVTAPCGLWLFGEEGVSVIHCMSYQQERGQQLFPEAYVSDLFSDGRMLTNRRPRP
jgi:hypothetical protein